LQKSSYHRWPSHIKRISMVLLLSVTSSLSLSCLPWSLNFSGCLLYLLFATHVDKGHSTTVRHFHTYFDIICRSPCRKWPRRLKVRHVFDVAGDKLDMPSGSRTLVDCCLNTGNPRRQAARCVAIARNAELEQGAARARSIETGVELRALSSTWFGGNSTCLRHQT
jgi:hypothetical protein